MEKIHKIVPMVPIEIYEGEPVRNDAAFEINEVKILTDWEFHYPKLFWEKENKHIGELSPGEFKKYLNELRSSGNTHKLKEIIRKMIERGSCFEGTLFLLPEEVKSFLENEKIWVLDERTEPLWKKYAGLPLDYSLKRMMDKGKRLPLNGWEIKEFYSRENT